MAENIERLQNTFLNEEESIKMGKKNLIKYKDPKQPEISKLKNFKGKEALIRLLQKTAEESFETEKVLYKALGVKNDDSNYSKNKLTKEMLYVFLEEAKFKDILDIMSTREFSNALFQEGDKIKFQLKGKKGGKNTLLQESRGAYYDFKDVSSDSKKEYLYESKRKEVKETTNEYIDEILNTGHLKEIFADQLKGVFGELINDLFSTENYYNNKTSTSITEDYIKNLNKETMEIKDEGIKYSLSYLGSSTFAINIIEDRNNTLKRGVDVFGTYRNTTNLTKENINFILTGLIKIIYDVLLEECNKQINGFDEKLFKKFRKKTTRYFFSFLKNAYQEGMTSMDLLKKTFPENQGGIQGTLGEKMFAALLAEKWRHKKNYKVEIMGQDLNRLKQQAHADILIKMGGKKIGIQAKQYNGTKFFNKVNFYNTSYNIFGDSLQRYLGEDKGKYLIPYLRYISLVGDTDLAKNIEDLLTPYFLNFSRIQDETATGDLSGVKNNFFVYKFALIPLSSILYDLIEFLESNNEDSDFFSLDLFNDEERTKVFFQKGNNNLIAYAIERTTINENGKKEEIDNLVIWNKEVKFSGIPLRLKKILDMK